MDLRSTLNLVLLSASMILSCTNNDNPATIGIPHNMSEKFVEVYGHRGARSYSPENTIPSYRTALKVGVNWVDADIVMSKDKQIFIYHDLRLNPDITRNKNGQFITDRIPIYTLTSDQLLEYDVGMINPNSDYAKFFPSQVPVNGTRMPRLEEMIKYVKDKSKNIVNFQFEIKSDPSHPELSPSPELFAHHLYEILKKHDIVARVEIQAFDWRYLYALQDLDKTIKTAYLVDYSELAAMKGDDPQRAGLWTGGKLLKDYNYSFPQMVKSLGGACFEPEDAALTKSELDEAHKLGLKVAVWTWPENTHTTFNEALIKQLIDWGIDGIITDDPARLNSMLAARNYPVPKNYQIK
jgi:glycerophosphoryl diester phosphodiesterase